VTILFFNARCGHHRRFGGSLTPALPTMQTRNGTYSWIPAFVAATARALKILVLTLTLVALPASAWASGMEGEEEAPAKATDPVTAAFSAYSALSTVELDHSVWSQFLSKTVVFAGYATQRLSRGRKRAWIGSKLRYGNSLPSRYENNRVVLGSFEEEHFDLIRRYREGLESIPERVPLGALNRAEQLAYWLNLYNVHALEHVAAHYPATTTRDLRSAPGEPPEGVWHERTLEVAGAPLSLVDIERKILFPIWDDPRVLYGLWQGAIGGPRLPLRAYTGATVWGMLEDNAREFINSNRGMRPDGEELEVSLLYGWGAPLLKGETALRRHIAIHALPPFSNGLERARRVEIDLYDWHLADLSGGTHHQGQWNNLAGFVFAMGNDPRNQALANVAIQSDDTHHPLPAPTVELLQNMDRFNDRERRGRVTIEECPQGSGCAAPAESDATEKEADTAPDSGR